MGLFAKLAGGETIPTKPTKSKPGKPDAQQDQPLYAWGKNWLDIGNDWLFTEGIK